MRRGRVVERVELGTERGRLAARAKARCSQAALQQFYELRAAPPEVHVPAEPDEREALEGWLSARAGRKVRVVVPQRGEKRGLVELASRNAALAYETRFNQATAARYDALETLQSVLGLPALPRRIECFDISTIQGSETVASMVVCEDGRMKRGRLPEVPDCRSGTRPPAATPSCGQANPRRGVGVSSRRGWGPAAIE